MASNTTSASKVVVRNILISAEQGGEEESPEDLGNDVVIDGVACSMPYTIKVTWKSVNKKFEDKQDEAMKKEHATNLIKSISETLFKETELIFSEFNPESEVSRINETISNETIFEVSSPLASVISCGLTANMKTRGYFDIGVGPLLLPVPTPESRSIPCTFKQAFLFTPASQGNPSKLQKLHPSARLAVSGIAKGWAVDELSLRLKNIGFDDVFVNWAGDIRVRGVLQPGVQNRKWKVIVTEPNIPGQQPLATLFLQAPNNKAQPSPSAVATSGSQYQGSHIYNPQSRDNLSSLTQATIVAENCMVADCLATACIASQSLPNARKLMDSLRIDSFGCVEDFILYSSPTPASSNVPLITRMQVPGVELPEHQAIRKTKHKSGIHVVIVGAGLAGLCAAVEAAEHGARVTILDKANRVGGNSSKATSGINGWGTPAQLWQNIQDEERYFERDTFLSGKGGNCDLSMVRMLSTQSGNAIRWLASKFDLNLSVVSQLGGHSHPRTHRLPPSSDGTPVPVGWTIVEAVRQFIESRLHDKVTILTSCSAEELILKENTRKAIIDGDSMSPSRKMKRTSEELASPPTSRPGSAQPPVRSKPYKEVIGVRYRNLETNEVSTLISDATIICTGGFSADHSENSYLARYRPDLIGVPTTNGAFATGDGMRLCERIGANLIDMAKVQLHPTGFINPKDGGNLVKFLAPEAIRGSGGILLNQKGQRFVNELDLRSVVAQAIADHCEPFPLVEKADQQQQQHQPKKQFYAWCVLPTEAQIKFGLPTLQFYKDTLGLMEGPFKNLDEVAKHINVDPEIVKKTIDDYREACVNGIDLHTRKIVFPAKFTLDANETYVVARVTPSLHYCMGGVEISPSAEVQERLEGSDQVFGRRRHIKRLFAAGEATGGVHGENRLGGNSLLECVVFGRIAGERAATISAKASTCLVGATDPEGWTPCVLREMRITDDVYGLTTRSLRFNMHSALQSSGLKVGQFLGVRGELDGETLVGWFSPITRPGDLGVVGILTRTDEKGGAISRLLNSLRPGSSCYLKSMGGLELDFLYSSLHPKCPMLCLNKNNRPVKRLGLLAGGTGIAPMVQLVRAYIRYMKEEEEMLIAEQFVREALDEHIVPLNLIYAAETSAELAFVDIMTSIQKQYPHMFRFYILLNQPPLGWTGGIGFINAEVIKEHMYFPSDPESLAVICGPPIFETIMGKTLTQLGFPRDSWYSFSQG